jgi:branched-chain amino acid aminotransferase
VLIWIDGELVDESAASVSVFDHGLIVGDGVFETAKVVDGVPFALRRHIARLQRSAAAIGLPEPDEAMVAKACTDVVAQAPTGLARLRVTYTGGPAPMGSGRGDGPPTLIAAVVPVAPYEITTKVAVVPWPRNERGALAGAKTTSYGENVVALARATSLGASEALFADTQGRLSEGTGSNVFVVIDGELLTPALSTGCLAGITRDLVLEWLPSREVEEPLDVLDRADEVFLTSSVRDVQAVNAIVFNDHVRELPAPGPVTKQAAEVFATRSQADVNP